MVGRVVGLLVLVVALSGVVSAQQPCSRCGGHHPVAHAVQGVGHTVYRTGAHAVAAAKTVSMVATGRLSHAGRLAGDFEGVGRGSTPQAAIAAACRPGRGYQQTVVSVQQGRGGQYYATVGYTRVR